MGAYLIGNFNNCNAGTNAWVRFAWNTRSWNTEHRMPHNGIVAQAIVRLVQGLFAVQTAWRYNVCNFAVASQTNRWPSVVTCFFLSVSAILQSRRRQIGDRALLHVVINNKSEWNKEHAILTGRLDWDRDMTHTIDMGLLRVMEWLKWQTNTRQRVGTMRQC